MHKKLSLILFIIPCSISAKPQQTSKKKTKPVVIQSGVVKKTSVEKKAEPAKLPDSAYIVDRIEAVIFGSEVTDLVTLSDIQRIGFDGQYHNKDDVIASRLMFHDAMRYRITMDEAAVEEYMKKVAKNTGSSLNDIKAMFSEAGYTYEEGRRQFAMMFANNQMVDHKIRSRLIIPEQLVVEYYEANPIITQASYILERGFVPTAPQDQEEIQKKVTSFIKTGKGLEVSWYQLPEISQEDIAEDKQFILSLKKDEISKPIQIRGGFELFRLKEKKPAHVVPLDDRYREIVEILRRPKFEEMLADYKKELLDGASILYL